MRSRLGAFAVILGAALITAGCVGFRNATSTPIVRIASVQLEQLPSNATPLRIALLSDFHVGNIGMRPERLSSIVRSVNASKPDIVLLAGDFVVGESKDGTAERSNDLALLADIRAARGVFAVLGNHDHWTDGNAIHKRLTHAGVNVLENQAVKIGPVTLVGLGDRFSGHDDIALAATRSKALGGIPVAFTHSPDLASDLPDSFPLLLAGHTHCGQMVAPIIGPIVRYSQWRRLYNPKYRCGRIDEVGRTTFVTAGVGSGAVPLRFNAMPDWWLIELRGVPVRPGGTPLIGIFGLMLACSDSARLQPFLSHPHIFLLRQTLLTSRRLFEPVNPVATRLFSSRKVRCGCTLSTKPPRLGGAACGWALRGGPTGAISQP